MKASSRPPTSSPSPGRTPESSCLLLTHSDLKSLMATDSGPIKLVPNAHKWLKSKGWILAGDPYDCTHLVTILATAALTLKQLKLKNATIVVAFLLETDITNHVSNALAEAVTRKTVDRIGELVEKLGSMANFLAANNAKYTESILALKATSNTLAGVSFSLDMLASKLASPTPATTQSPTWASVAKAAPTCLTPLQHGQHQDSNNLTPQDLISVQQHQLCNTQTVLIFFNSHDDNAPKNFTATSSLTLHDKLNTLLGQLNINATTLCQEDGEVNFITPST
ncbi:hypothetical protein J132_01948 [Termitomyces sp. J132]|nr:hypothetical protein J132_01948 [Termitomyces sp. J132]